MCISTYYPSRESTRARRVFDLNRGVDEGALDGRELNACFCVNVVYSKRFENPKNLSGIYISEARRLGSIFRL